MTSIKMKRSSLQRFPTLINFIARSWIELGTVLLLLLLLTSFIRSFSNTVQSQYTITNTNFTLPAEKIQSDLTILRDNSDVKVLLIVNNQVHPYDAIIIQISGVNGASITTPQANKNINLSIRLLHTTQANIVDFIIQLANTSVIYLLPTKLAATNSIPPG